MVVAEVREKIVVGDVSDNAVEKVWDDPRSCVCWPCRQSANGSCLLLVQDVGGVVDKDDRQEQVPCPWRGDRSTNIHLTTS